MRKLDGINLAIASGSEKIQNCLLTFFKKQNANVSLCGFLNMEFVRQMEQNLNADVILIDMDDSYEEDEEALDALLERIDLPILFHDNDFDDLNDPTEGCGFSEQAIDKLADKLAELVENSGKKSREKQVDATEAESESVTEPDVAKIIEKISSELESDELILIEDEAEDFNVSEQLDSEDDEPTLKLEQTAELLKSVELAKPTSTNDFIIPGAELDDSDHAVNVWVLGSSIGGPESLKRFMARIPAELPVAFVIAQHLGDGFVSLLASQLDRVSRFNVREASVGEILQHGDAVVVPVENRMTLSPEGRVDFTDEAWKGHYKPSIDCVINDVTESFKTRSGVIIFSGMGADGVLASQKFSEQYQGRIWAQTPDTCVISSMPDSVRKANLVSYSGSPEALALKISMLYMGKGAHVN